jgi:hypothetical protein
VVTADKENKTKFEYGGIAELIGPVPRSRYSLDELLFQGELVTTPISHEGLPSVACDFNCRRISQKFSPAGVTSPSVARAMHSASFE